MVNDEYTQMSELLAEAVSLMSKGKDNVDRFEGEPILKLLGISGTEEDLDAECSTWTDRLLSSLELYEVVRSQEISLAEVESWTNDLRVWYQQACLEDSKKKDGESDLPEDFPEEDEPDAVEVVQLEKEVDGGDEVPKQKGISGDEGKKAKKKRKMDAVKDPSYTKKDAPVLKSWWYQRQNL